MPPPERRTSDTPRSYAALCDYIAMGPARSDLKASPDRDDPGLTKAANEVAVNLEALVNPAIAG